MPRSGRIAAVVILASAALVSLAWMRPFASPSPHALAKLERVAAPELGRGLERWHMIGPAGDTVTALWRAPEVSRAEWTVVMLGGIGTDDRAVSLVPDSLPVGVLAVSWPWKGSRHMSRWEFVGNIPAMRAALIRTPGALARGVEAVRRVRPDARVAMIGASLGVPPATAALSLERTDALVLVDGAADLGGLLRSEGTRALGGGPVAAGFAWLVAPIAAWLVSPLEPLRHADRARDIPTLMVSAEHEERLPRDCVDKLHARFPHATFATHPGGHLRPRDRRQVSAALATVWRWLEAVEPRAR